MSELFLFYSEKNNFQRLLIFNIMNIIIKNIIEYIYIEILHSINN